MKTIHVPLSLLKQSYILKRIPVPPSVHKLQGNGNSNQHKPQNHCSIVKARKLPFPVPAPLFLLAKAAKLHSIGYHFNPFHTGENEGHQNSGSSFEAVHQAFFAGQLHAPCLLRQGDSVKFVQYVWNIPQGQRNGVRDLVAYADLI